MSKRKRGFTLVELLVVIGIIAVLISLLMPSLTKARNQAKFVQCQSNLRQVGVFLVNYCNDNNGYLFPANYGAGQVHNVPVEDPKNPNTPWPVFVIKPAAWNPPLLICPADPYPGPDEHSYLLNNHLSAKENEILSQDPTNPQGKDIRFSTHLQGIPSEQIVVMGEKADFLSNGNPVKDYYMDVGDYNAGKVEPYRHGVALGSNYLFLDMHVGLLKITGQNVGTYLDPWDPTDYKGSDGQTTN
jgi:prepilin-type N-terminal cleavage/methylation domain-containing protein